ncbi:ATP-binding cassette domain-containing protein|uniref:ATP-binding cassette domain-containing protein n=1 Tax=Leuconostoc lactis TaxID=1246 RepID=A0A6L7ABX3_LEULA|nr:ATP-binding cassette domain-containing protein [Leuconostoc lactis]
MVKWSHKNLRDQLSGGQQQRVSLARTLTQNPSVLLADEPVAALDPVTAHEVMDDFKRINQELGQTVLINIHHVDLARRKVGMIFQSYNLVPRISVLKNVMSSLVPDMPFWRVLFGVFSKTEKIRALEALDRMSMLDKAFVRTPNGVKGLQDINLEIQDGEFIGIIGMSGAGKSTLIRTINRLNNITEGQLTVDGIEISTLKGQALRQ